MKKSIFKTSALKKALDKKTLLYYEDNNRVIAWGENGIFALSISKLLFDTEIITSVPTRPVQDISQTIKNIFNGWDDIDQIQSTKLLMTLPTNKTAALYKNSLKNYIVPIDVRLIDIINNVESYTVKQDRKISPIMFEYANINIVLMPLRDGDITKHLMDTIGGLIV